MKISSFCSSCKDISFSTGCDCNNSTDVCLFERVPELPKIETASECVAYILPDESVYILSFDKTEFLKITMPSLDLSEFAKKNEVVNLYDNQLIGGVKDFEETPLVNGKEVALKIKTETHKVEGLDEANPLYKEAFGEETFAIFTRNGIEVDFYAQVQIVDYRKLSSSGINQMAKVFNVPKGYKNESTLPVIPLVICTDSTKSVTCNAYYRISEYESNYGINVYANANNIYYIKGNWHTDEPDIEKEYDLDEKGLAV